MKLVVLEPFGNQELDNYHWIEEVDLAYLVVQGDDVPVPSCSEIELYIYQCHGYDISTEEDLWELQESGTPISISMDEWVARAIEWYTREGYVAEQVRMAGLVSGLE